MKREKIIEKARRNIEKCKKIGICNEKDSLRKYLSLEALLPRGIIHMASINKPTMLVFARPLTRMHNHDCPRRVDQYIITLYARMKAYEKGAMPKPLLKLVEDYRKNGAFFKGVSKK